MASPWRQADFLERLDWWVAEEKPPAELRLLVSTWLLSRVDDPYAGALRAAGFENLWYAVVPGSLRDDRVVVCSYWIEELGRSIRCDSITTLSWPV